MNVISNGTLSFNLCLVDQKRCKVQNFKNYDI